MKKKFEMKMDITLPSKAEIKKKGDDAPRITKAIQTGCLRASNIVEADLPRALNTALESNVWGPFSPKYPYFRKNGQAANPGMRNIVDTGALRDSLRIKTKFMQTKVQTVIVYGAPYANLVHYGGAITPYGNRNASTVLLPARPWVEATLTGGNGIAKYDLKGIYQAQVEKAFSEA